MVFHNVLPILSLVLSFPTNCALVAHLLSADCHSTTQNKKQHSSPINLRRRSSP